MSNVTDEKPRVLIVDDEPAIRELLAEILSDDFTCVTCESAEAALERFRAEGFELVVTDINMGGMSGVEMSPHIRRMSPDTVLLMISGAQDVDTAIEAMRVGVFDYIRKPFQYSQVRAAVDRAIKHHRSLVAKRLTDTALKSLVVQKSAELDHLATHDEVTGLPNKKWFENRLRDLSSKTDNPTAVVLIGITNLRVVRDSIGHQAANKVLVEAAGRFQSRLPEKCPVAKLDGDVFAVLVPRGEPSEFVDLARLAIEIMQQTFTVEGREFQGQINIGMSVFPTDGSGHHDLIRNAGAALSQAEARGSGCYEFYSDEMNSRAIMELALQNNLRHALERNELHVFYQPKIDIFTRRVNGMEALLRWQCGELGNISPDIFIAVAESTGLIIPIGEWVLETACRQAKAWHDEGFQLSLAVNLSARQFHDKTLLTKICKTLETTGIDPHYLNLEVTESSILTNMDSAVEVLGRLQNLGISISIDDFGTGHSSLGYLRSLPVDVLKIDKTFVAGIAENTDARVLVKAMITLAHDLRLRAVAEGVETEEQLNVLSELECDEWQGYLQSKPLSCDEFIQKLRAEASR